MYFLYHLSEKIRNLKRTLKAQGNRQLFCIILFDNETVEPRKKKARQIIEPDLYFGAMLHLLLLRNSIGDHHGFKAGIVDT